MIVFHEGLPRSGKSYEAVTKHILPSIEKGRPVYSNINGLYEGAEKIASLINKPVDYVQSHIHKLSDDDIYVLQDVVPPDALIAIDEIQNYYPSGRQTLPKATIKYISEHAQDGHDIILMGQAFSDIAPIWRKRTQRKILFSKRTGIGRPDEYTWIAYEAISPEKFKKVTSGGGEYEEKFFGTYKSHKDGTENTTFAYADDRTNVFKQKSLLWGVPAAMAVTIFAIWYLYGFFNEPAFAQAEKPEPQLQLKPSEVVQLKPAAPEKPEPQLQTKPSEEYQPVDYLDKLAHQYRLRLSAALYDAEGDISHALIDAYDASDHLKERFYLQDISALGWEIKQKVYGLDIEKQGVVHVVRPFPLGDMYGRVNKSLADSL